MAATARLPNLPRRPTPTALLPRGATAALTPREDLEVRAAQRRLRRSWLLDSPLARPLPWLVAALLANGGLYVATVAHEAHLTRWRTALGQQRQQNVQLRAALSSARSLSWVDTRARGLGLGPPNAIAYLPPVPAPARRKPPGPIALGAAEGY